MTDQQYQDRMDKTSKSILISWAINNAVNSLGGYHNSDDWELYKERVKERYPFFIELYREWMKKPVNGNEKWDSVKQEWYNKEAEIEEINKELSETENYGK